MIDMPIGTVFTARDKLGTEYKYLFIGISKEAEVSYENIHLRNLTDGTDTFVESAWFDNRSITL